MAHEATDLLTEPKEALAPSASSEPVDQPRPSPRGRIEGGVDALVLGATFDGLAAAALLGKAGLKTILLGGEEAEPSIREFAPGYRCVDGEHLVGALDPELVSALDLYRHGLAYAARRLDTVYFFSDGAALLTDGDIYRLRESVAAMSEADAAAFAAFAERALDAAQILRGVFEGGDMSDLPAALADGMRRALHDSLEEVLDDTFTDERLKAMLAAEGSFRSAARPGDPFTFVSLVRRWAGEAAGLQGAFAYPEGGALGVHKAARRAAEAGRVDFRLAAAVKSVLVEWDGVAGVETEDGGQIRAPIVVCALDARRAFSGLIGANALDIEFQAGLIAPAPQIASVRVNFALAGGLPEGRAKPHLARRLFYAPSRLELRRAYNAAREGWREGEPAAPLIMEVVFPSALEAGLAPANGPEQGHVASALLHPAPYRLEADESFARAVERAARATFEKIAPGVSARIRAVDIRLPPEPAAPPVLAAWARARHVAAASGVRGLFFCGPEAQVGPGIQGAAARRAAQAAIRYHRGRG
ncbi:phytoene desaturase family protein [Amphiplicatus metriothermophilus]|uniref:Phytoene dehydrogenase-related protein n=1 Tax=Amphiplicatus metriothermophilus TaxID=1519374 RepID=A0A239PT54_9PROT|nr:hypothetical protein [Amphiplicatus metriothermophilus]MBB5519359.1 phytoene dehydrogenase-like protein [Amphiplicatus metriothermophilus]SNT73469.1 Phytoene dehydrogenase-related protein [Amphiplicatus metriothermophilus]